MTTWSELNKQVGGQTTTGGSGGRSNSWDTLNKIVESNYKRLADIETENKRNQEAAASRALKIFTPSKTVFAPQNVSQYSPFQQPKQVDPYSQMSIAPSKIPQQQIPQVEPSFLDNAKKWVSETLSTAGDVVRGLSPLGTAEEKKYALEAVKGGAKNLGEAAMGIAKLAIKTSPLGGIVGQNYGKDIGQFLGTKFGVPTMPENKFYKMVDQFVDNNGVLNYHPDYTNKYQQLGAGATEIGTWFIPLTRSSKVEQTLARAEKAIPYLESLTGTIPKIIKSGSKFFFEVGKDVADVSILDAMRGKSWEEVKKDIEGAAIGGTVLRGIGKSAESVIKAIKPQEAVKVFKETVGRAISTEEKNLLKVHLDNGGTVEDFVKAATGKEPVIKTEADVQKAIQEGKVKDMTTPKSESTVIHLPQENVYAKVTPEQFKVLNKEVENIPFSAKDNVHLTPLEKVTGKAKEVSIDEIKKLSPNATEALLKVPEIKTPKIEANIPSAKKVSGVSTRIEEKTVSEKISKAIEGKAEFKGMNIKNDVQESARIIQNDIIEARSIIRGEKPVPEQVTNSGSFHAAMEVYADGLKDRKLAGEIYSELARSPIASDISIAGQTLRAIQERNPESAVSRIKEVINARKKSIEGKLKSKDIKKATKVITKEIKESIKRVGPTKETWASFVESIKCK